MPRSKAAQIQLSIAELGPEYIIIHYHLLGEVGVVLTYTESSCYMVLRTVKIRCMSEFLGCVFNTIPSSDRIENLLYFAEDGSIRSMMSESHRPVSLFLRQLLVELLSSREPTDMITHISIGFCSLTRSVLSLSDQLRFKSLNPIYRLCLPVSQKNHAYSK